MPSTSEKTTARLITCPPRILGMCRTDLNKTVRPCMREFNSHGAKHSLATFTNSLADFYGGNRNQRSKGEHK